VSIDGAQIAGVTRGGRMVIISPTWQPGPPGGIGDVSFTNAGDGWAVTDASWCAAFKSDCTETIELYATTDGGKHWTRILHSRQPA